MCCPGGKDGSILSPRSALLTAGQRGGTSVPMSLQLLLAGKLPSSQDAGVTVKGIKKRREEAAAAAALQVGGEGEGLSEPNMV